MEAETKLAGLQQDIGQLSTMSDTEVAMEEAQAEQLQQVGSGGHLTLPLRAVCMKAGHMELAQKI